MDRYILDKMEDQREYAVKQLSMTFRASNIDEIATCVSYAFLDGLPSACNLIADANLSLIDCYAILGDTERFYELWDREESHNTADLMNDREELKYARCNY